MKKLIPMLLLALCSCGGNDLNGGYQNRNSDKALLWIKTHKKPIKCMRSKADSAGPRYTLQDPLNNFYYTHATELELPAIISEP